MEFQDVTQTLSPMTHAEYRTKHRWRKWEPNEQAPTIVRLKDDGRTLVTEHDIPEIIRAADFAAGAGKNDNPEKRGDLTPATKDAILELAARCWTPPTGDTPGRWNGTRKEAQQALDLIGKSESDRTK